MKKPKNEVILEDEAKRQLEMSLGYVKVLEAISGVSVARSSDEDGKTWVFTPTAKNSLKVTLDYSSNFRGQALTSLVIEGVECGYWHTGEEKNLDFHILLAQAALQGDVAYNRSRLFRFKEVCFRVGDSWVCTLTDKSKSSYHYITHRKKLRGLVH